jgi:hypothetical protein
MAKVKRRDGKGEGKGMRGKYVNWEVEKISKIFIKINFE